MYGCVRNAYYIKSIYFTITEDVHQTYHENRITLFVKIDISQSGGIIERSRDA